MAVFFQQSFVFIGFEHPTQNWFCFSKEAAPNAAAAEQHPVFVAELFHGPTYCFKDLGQQLLVRLLARFAERDKQKKTFLASRAQRNPLGKMSF